ncbi:MULTISPECIES: hypothetical protein [unclassified Clostridium]|uniref:hypothetical protein n=1 Tax=unclassified Clostridium TaxID=2614128 RepID=UPI0002978B8E|nr:MULTISPECIES: hypothetical protein [unclassified Clostridium]EKQ58099.1 MAG: hypothetical protein A370_00289 [Clostridium sp. Maddingley MBC34-26]
MNINIRRLLLSALTFSIIFFISPLVQIKAYSDSKFRNQWHYDVNYVVSAGRNVEAWNYYGDDGKPKDGWFNVGGKWYYGEQRHDDDYYGIYIDSWAPAYYAEYTDSNYSVHEDVGPYDYYCGSDGAMKTGWFQAYALKDYNKEYGLHWYYAGTDGKILKNTYTPDGFWVNADGIYK